MGAADKERERRGLDIWQIFTDSRQWYEKEDGSYIFWSASCEFSTPNEFVGKTCTIGQAEWRLSDKLGNVYYTVKGNDSVTCAGKDDCGVFPPTKGWKCNDFSDTFESSFGNSGRAPAPTLCIQTVDQDCS